MAIVISSELMTALGGSFMTCSFLVATQKWHGRLSFDHDLQGVQKIHTTPVPRIGGVGVAIGLCAATIAASFLGERRHDLMLIMLACSLPAFIAGLIEDLTKKVSVRMRLHASFASAALGIWAMDAQLTRLDTPGTDAFMAFAPFSVLFTCFAVSGMTNAVNIIDGLNGLAAGCVTLMLAGLAAISWQVGDITVMNLCLWGIAALVGFLCLNFPFGRIFLGDGGAYLAGFWLAECGILLLKRNPEVSTWAVLLCCLYPVWETLFSVYRRQIIHRVSSGNPDMTHMHHLIYGYVSNKYGHRIVPAWLTHGLSSGLIWCLMLVCPVIAALFYEKTTALMVAAGVFVIVYNSAYKKLIKKHKSVELATESSPVRLA